MPHQSYDSIVEDEVDCPTTSPHNFPSSEEINRHLAQTLNQLQLQEREGALHDVHGVSEVIDESPELIDRKLDELQSEIDHYRNKGAYLEAKKQSPTFVSSRKFLLLFLRAEKYDSKKAAARIARHFQLKLDIFGKEKLARDILLSDITNLKVLHSGYLQLLPQKDSVGRTVIFSDSGKLSDGVTKGKWTVEEWVSIFLATGE